MANGPVTLLVRKNRGAVCQTHPGFEKVKALGVDGTSNAFVLNLGAIGSLPVELARAPRCAASPARMRHRGVAPLTSR